MRKPRCKCSKLDKIRPVTIMKRTIIALATVIAASLIVDIVFPKSAASQVSSPIVGYWGSGDGGVGETQIDFFSNSEYKYVGLVKGTGVHSYNIYGRTTEAGNFEVSGNTIVLHPHIRVKQDAIGRIIENSSIPNGASIYLRGALQNGGQTLVIQDGEGRAAPFTRIHENFAQ